MSYLDLCSLLAPEIIVLVTALLALFADASLGRDNPVRPTVAGGLAAIGCAIAIVWVFVFPNHGTTLEDMVATTPLTQFAKQIILGLAIFHILISLRQKFTNHIGEYFALMLLGGIGMMLLVSSNNLLMIFIALELTSLSLYVLVAFAKNKRISAEAALKYFLFGGMSAAFMLFGFSFLFGMTGELNVVEMGRKLNAHRFEPVFYLALILTLVGLGFKVATAPFHLWAPDVYHGAPTPVASYIASASKVASFFVLSRIFVGPFSGFSGHAGWTSYASGWAPLIAILAVTSMIVGNLAAIAQQNVKRLLAYSAVAHAGYALLGLISNGQVGLESLFYYVVTYAITVAGAFGVIAVLEEHEQGFLLSDFAGLSQRAPLLAFSMLIFILSLAGIPPLAGFFGKFFIFVSVLEYGSDSLNLLWIVVLAIAMSAVSFYYYLQILKQVYVATPVSGTELKPIRVGFGSSLAITILSALVVILGCAPDLLLGRLVNLLKLSSF